MFRPRQNLPVAPAVPAVLPQIEATETGEVVLSYKDQSKFVLPDVSATRLRDLLEAGVDLKQVNSKIFPATEVNLEITDVTANNETKEVENAE